MALIASAIIGSCRENDEISYTPGAAAESVYKCLPPRAVPAESVWPIPEDAERTKSGIYTKPIRLGKGRKAQLGSGQTLVICATYYDRAGAVVRHEPTIVHNIDAPAWQDALLLMAEEEVRRLWIPRAGANDFEIVDLELEPFPVKVPTFVRPKRDEESTATTGTTAPTSTH